VNSRQVVTSCPNIYSHVDGTGSASDHGAASSRTLLLRKFDLTVFLLQFNMFIDYFISIFHAHQAIPFTSSVNSIVWLLLSIAPFSRFFQQEGEGQEVTTQYTTTATYHNAPYTYLFITFSTKNVHSRFHFHVFSITTSIVSYFLC
jgi:hypothetical protein